LARHINATAVPRARGNKSRSPRRNWFGSDHAVSMAPIIAAIDRMLPSVMVESNQGIAGQSPCVSRATLCTEIVVSAFVVAVMSM
jgi:hypothetical protein